MYVNWTEAYYASLRRMPYLTDEHAAIIYSGAAMAQALDEAENPTTNLIAEFNKHVKYMLALSPKDAAVDDPVEKLLNAVSK